MYVCCRLCEEKEKELNSIVKEFAELEQQDNKAKETVKHKKAKKTKLENTIENEKKKVK